MATPFTAFRKYTGALMAVLCGLLMVSFVVADPLMQMLGGGGNRLPSEAKDTVAAWDGGHLNELELAEAVRHRMVLAEFQRQVYGLGARDAQAAGLSDVSLASLRVRPLDLPSTPEQGVEADVVRTKIFAQRAREAGMVISDEMIVDYLKALGRDRVSSDQMRAIMNGMKSSAGRRATISFVFDLLREAMLSKNYLTSHQYVLGTVLPEERWEDWLTVNDRVVLEAAPIPAFEFVDDVADPSEAELAEYFAEYRDRAPAPDVLTEYGGVQLPSPLPAFATPPRVQTQYVVAKFSDFTDRLMDQVTDEEIAKYYEENKDRFISADRVLFGDDDLFGESKDETDETETEEAASPTTEETATEETTIEDAPAEEQPTEPVSDEEPADASNEPATTEPEPESPTEEAAAEEPAAEESASEEPGETVAEEEEEEEEEEVADADEPSTESSDESDAETTGPRVVYQPLDEVRDEIRRRLAENKAVIEMRDLINGVKQELDNAYADHFSAVLDATDANADPPAPPAALTDLAPLAGKHGLEFVVSDPQSRIELGKTPYGMSINADQSAERPLPLWYIVFSEGMLDSHEPVLTFDGDNNFYLSVVTDRFERVTPELDDIRDQVVDAWKRDKAADLAVAAARELADKVGESGLSIEGYLANNPDTAASGAFETDPMSFMSVAGVSERTGEVILRLSQPEPLVAPGPELLEQAFDLEADQVGAALNHDRTIAYVMRVQTRLTPLSQIRSQFLAEGGAWYGAGPLSRTRQFRSMTTVFQSLLEDSGLDWKRDPDQPR